MYDPPRKEIPEAIKNCRSAGIKVVMITGDYSLTAESIARQANMIEGKATIVKGSELAKMDNFLIELTLEVIPSGYRSYIERVKAINGITPTKAKKIESLDSTLDGFLEYFGTTTNNANQFRFGQT